MSVLVVRHGLSEANNRENVGTLAFASGEAPLMEPGIEQARALTDILLKDYGMRTSDTPVATSILRRTQQTAQEAGFQQINTYVSLNEVAHGIELKGLRAQLDRRELPEIAIETAQMILADPPVERIWITHGLVIASLCNVLDVSKEARFIPRFCEIRELPI